MNDAQLRALAAAAADGVDFDGLRVEETTAGYDLETPEVHREGVSRDGLRSVAEEASAYVTNWYFFACALGSVTDAGYAYLRWLERAEDRPVPERYGEGSDGLARTWGQLRVSVTIDSGGARTYEVRHVDDVDADRADLDVHTDPLEARQIAKYDDRDRYRPLKSAPTLRTGWAFPGLGPEELLDAIDFFYPASIANWDLERRGTLDVTHWRETADRQTGIYDVIEELSPEAVSWAASACCVDAQCLKRRRWEYDEDTTVPVEPGDGAFPCREPCSLLIAAAREWALGEREDERSYTFELTPSERDQLVAIVDAVADGDVAQVRAADFDHPANQYRARYLRAKRFGADESAGDGGSGD